MTNVTNNITFKTLDLMRFDEDQVLVRGIDAMGREYILEEIFSYAGAAKKYLEITDAFYIVDATCWACRTPYGSDAWDADGMEATLYDDEERSRYGF